MQILVKEKFIFNNRTNAKKGRAEALKPKKLRTKEANDDLDLNQKVDSFIDDF